MRLVAELTEETDDIAPVWQDVNHLAYMYEVGGDVSYRTKNDQSRQLRYL